MKHNTKIDKEFWSLNMICSIGLALEGKREAKGSGKKTDVRKISWRINDSECVCTTVHVSDGFSEAVFSCTAVETNDQQHSAFCSTYSSWKVYKTLKLSSFVSLHVPLFSFTLNAFHFSLSKSAFIILSR